MRILYITMLLLFCTQVVLAQDTLKFKDGQLTTFPNKVCKDTEFKIDTQCDVDFQNDDIKSIKEFLLLNISETINNLENDSLKLRVLYKRLWGNDFYETLLKECYAIEAWLKDEKMLPGSNAYVPDYSKIELATIKGDIKKKKYELKHDDKAPGKETLNTHNLIQNDALKLWFIHYYNNAPNRNANNWDDMKHRQEYLKGWRKLEALYAKLSMIDTALNNDLPEGELKKKIADTYKEIEIQKKECLDKNVVLSYLQSDYIKKWLWFTGGMPATNPVYITTQVRAYPKTEKHALYGSKEDSLFVAANIASINGLLAAYAIVNNITVPVSDDKVNLLYVNAQTWEDNRIKDKVDIMGEGMRNTLCIFNVTEAESLTVTVDTVALSGNGKFTDGAMTFFSAFTGVKSAIASVSDAMGGMMGIINGYDKPQKVVVVDAKANSLTKSEEVIQADIDEMKDNLLWLNKSDLAFANKFIANLNTAVKDDKAQQLPTIIVDDIEYILTKTDTLDKAMLFQLYLSTNNLLIKKVQITEFLKREKNVQNALDYSTDQMLKTSVNAFFARAQNYTSSILSLDSSYKSLKLYVASEKAYMATLIRIPDRSLPLQELKPVAYSDKSIKYNTRIEALPEYTNRKVTVHIKGQQVEKTKDEKGAEKVVFGPSFEHKKFMYKTGNYYRVWGSAGVAYIFSDYTNNVVTTNDAKEIGKIENKNPQFIATAGVNIYPFRKYYPLDDRLIGHKGAFLSRVSLYEGIGITEGSYTKHFFSGIGFDIVPGLKIVPLWHFYIHTKYEVVENKVVSEHAGFKSGGPALSINVDPIVFTSIIGLFKK